MRSDVQVTNNNDHEMFQNVVEFIQDATCAINSNQIVIAWNKEMENLTGIRQGEIIGKNLTSSAIAFLGKPCRMLTDFIFSNDVNIQKYYKNLKRDGDSICGESFVTGVNKGRGAYLWANASMLRDTSGEIIGAIETIRDITDWKDAERSLQESEEKQRKLIETLRDIVYTIDSDGKLTHLSTGFEEISGYSLEDVIGHSFTEFITPQYRDKAEQIFNANVGTEKISTYNLEIQGKKGKIIPVEVRGAPLFNNKGEHIGRIGIARDITERKEKEKTVRENEKRYRTIFETTGTATVIIEDDMTISLVNAEFEKISGYSREEIEGKKSWTDFVYQADREWMVQQHKNRRQEDTSALRNYEFRFIDRNRSIKYILLTTSMISETGRSVASLLDLTERKQSEMLTKSQRDLAANLNKFTRLNDVLKACGETAIQISQMDCGGVYLLNEETDALELIYYKGLSHEFAERVTYYSKESSNVQLVKKGEPIYCQCRDLDHTIMLPKSEENIQSLAIIPIHYEGRAIACLNVASYFMKEISLFTRTALESIASQVGAAIARVKAEEALRKSEEMFRALAENSSDTIMRFDRRCRHIYVSPKAEQEKGIPLKAFIGKTHRELGFPEDLVEQWESAIHKVFETKQPNRIEFMLPSSIWIDWSLVPEFDENMEVKAVITSARDITERIIREQELKDNEERYRVLMEHVADGVALTINGTIIYANQSFVNLFGFSTVDYVVGKYMREFIRNDYKEEFFKDMEKKEIEKQAQKMFQTVCLVKDDCELWVEGYHNVIQWEGQPAVLTTMRDITERKRQERYEQEEKDRLKRENLHLKSTMKDRWRLGAIIGKSAAMQEVYELIQRAAGADVSVIIYGESGTGKELVAKAIHDMSSRKDGEFVPVNCGAIPENLLESEFFGHKKGAFTGAHIDKHGYLDLANGGSLFLDEIGELGMNIQVKLLRALEGGGYTPIGSARVQNSDFRIIAATNRDLVDHVKEGMMREDFFYRIHIVPITVPPLRERREDIPLLIEHFLKRNGNGSKTIQIPGKIMDALYYYDWPGNVRELQNVLHRYLTIKSLDFMSPSSSRMASAQDYTENKYDENCTNLIMALERYEKSLIMRTLEQNKWHRIKAAYALGISRHTLFRKMKNYEIV